MMNILVIAATAMALAAPAFAQTPSAAPPATQPAMEDKFAKVDGDKNGSLSIAEVKLADATVTQADFDKFDADKSKSLSKAEFDKWAMTKHGDKASAPGQ